VATILIPKIKKQKAMMALRGGLLLIIILKTIALIRLSGLEQKNQTRSRLNIDNILAISEGSTTISCPDILTRSN
jgi:hypothetical protein